MSLPYTHSSMSMISGYACFQYRKQLTVTTVDFIVHVHCNLSAVMYTSACNRWFSLFLCVYCLLVNASTGMQEIASRGKDSGRVQSVLLLTDGIANEGINFIRLMAS